MWPELPGDGLARARAARARASEMCGVKVEPGQQLRVSMERRLGCPRREGTAAQEWRESGARVASGPVAPSSRKAPLAAVVMPSRRDAPGPSRSWLCLLGRAQPRGRGRGARRAGFNRVWGFCRRRLPWFSGLRFGLELHAGFPGPPACGGQIVGLLSLHHCMSQALIMDLFVYICIHPLRSVSWRTLTNPRRTGGGDGGGACVAGLGRRGKSWAPSRSKEAGGRVSLERLRSRSACWTEPG